MQRTFNKLYKLKNGYKIGKGEYYDGYNMRYLWNIYEPSGKLYMACGSYKEAYELASHLIPEAN